jgi:hypothetical protein
MKHEATFVIYIDESGDEGFSFGHGSSEMLENEEQLRWVQTDFK